MSDDGMRRDAGRAAALARAACDGGLIYPGAPDECDRDNVERLKRRVARPVASAAHTFAGG